LVFKNPNSPASCVNLDKYGEKYITSNVTFYVTTQPLNILVYQDVMQKHKNMSKNISY